MLRAEDAEQVQAAVRWAAAHRVPVVPRGAGSGAETTTCYCSNYGICWRDARQGIWRNFKFNIIEC